MRDQLQAVLAPCLGEISRILDAEESAFATTTSDTSGKHSHDWISLHGPCQGRGERENALSTCMGATNGPIPSQ